MVRQKFWMPSVFTCGWQRRTAFDQPERLPYLANPSEVDHMCFWLHHTLMPEKGSEAAQVWRTRSRDMMESGSERKNSGKSVRVAGQKRRRARLTRIEFESPAREGGGA